MLGVDYTNQPSSVEFAPGATSVTVPLDLTPSAAFKTIIVTVLAGSGYSVGDPATASATIFYAAGLCVAPPPATPPIVNPNFTG